MASITTHNKLPDELPSQDKMLLVLASSTLARVFLIEDRDVHEFDPLSTDATDYQYSDKEWFSYTAPHTKNTSTTTVWFKETNKTHYEGIFVKFLAQKLQELQQEYHTEKIVIYSPETLLWLVKDAFPKQYADLVQVKPGNHINALFPKIVELIAA